MRISRRDLLKQAALAGLAGSLARGQAVDWQDALSLPKSRCFGLGADGRARDPGTLYRFDTEGGAPLSFDISNNQILCNLDAEGGMDRICINAGVLVLANASMSGGIYTSKAQVRGGPWRFGLAIGGPGEARSRTEVSLLGNLLPEFQWEQGPLLVRQVSFAPLDPKTPARSPRAVVSVFLVRNQGAENARVALTGPENLTARGAGGVASWMLFGEAKLVLEPGSAGVLEAAVLLEDREEKLIEAEKRLRSRPAIEWFRSSLADRSKRYGVLEVPAEPYYGESAMRFAETCRQSVLRLPDGKFGGGFMGSDIDPRDSNWNKDTYYCVLGSSLADPEICAAAIPFYFHWGLPANPTTRGLARFPGAGRVTQSLSLALAPLALATTYYRLSDDKDYFLRYPDFLKRACALSEDVLATRRGEAFLFPSMFISNGDARGHFHTGSNVVAWYAFRGLSRLAREVFEEEALADQWDQVSTRVRSSILEYCRGHGPMGRQYFEGVYEDRTYVPGHDGEESDTTLMPFYRFCPPDDPDLIHHAKTGLSPANPYYAKELDGIWWYNNSGFRPATAPAWATGLASAANEQEMKARLHRFRELTDLDGSLWWWPYRYGETDQAAVLRGNGTSKCGWVSAAYLLRFVQGVIGADIDVPARTLGFAPFCCWDEFHWKRARLGTAEFDLSYQSTGTGLLAKVSNRNTVPYTVIVRLTSRQGLPLQSATQDTLAEAPRAVTYYQMPALEFRVQVDPGAEAVLRANYRKP